MSVSTHKVERFLDALIEREGDYVDNPDDPGGETRWGITKVNARQHGYDGDMRELPQQRAREIYRSEYWYEPRFSDVAELSPAIAEELFDTGVNMGQEVAGQFLQRSLNAFNQKGAAYPDLVVDGRIGDRTLSALRAYLKSRPGNGEAVMLKALDCLQGARYIRLAEHDEKFESFTFGWMAHRIGSFHGSDHA